MDEDKSLGKILFCHKLSETSINYEEVNYHFEHKTKKKLKVIIEDIQKRPLFKDNNNINTINNNIRITMLDNKKLKTNSLQTMNNNHIEDVVHDKFEFLFINANESEDKNNMDIKKEYEYVKKFVLKKLVIEQKDYKSIISPYWLLFNYVNNLNSIAYSLINNREEVDKLIEYNENLYNKYLKRKNKLDNKIINNAINNIIFLCSEISSLLINDEGTILNPYVKKIQKYSIINQ